MMILKVSLVLGCLTTLALSTKSGRIGSSKKIARLRASEEKGGLDLDEDDELTFITYHKAHKPTTDEQKTYEPDQGAVIHKTHTRFPSKYSISRKAALMSNLVKTIIEGDKTAKEIEIENVSGAILSKIVEYLEYHDGKAPALINRPIRSCEMEKLVEDPWDEEFINKQTPNAIFQMILGANYMDIPSLLQLGCIKIATLIKGKSLNPEEINNFQLNLPFPAPAVVLAYIASHVVYNVNEGRDAYALCNAMGLTKKETSYFLDAGTFAEGERWDRFDDTDKGRNITLSNGNRTASRDGVVRAGKWVPREGHASATVRVDRVCHWSGLCLEIGVIGVPGRDYNWSTHNLKWNTDISAWCYDNYGDIYGKGCLLSKGNDNGMFDIPELTEGSEVTVTLTGGTVTFAHNGTDVHTLELPENCGPISLAVTIYGNGQVTLL